MSAARVMPPRNAIRKHWAKWLIQIGKFDSKAEIFEGNYCFACGFLYDGLERCHILPRCEGGLDDVDNLHLLCRWCHRASEFKTGQEYWDWFEQRHVFDVFLTQWSYAGGSFAQILDVMESRA